MVKWLNITGAIKWIFDNPIPNTVFSVIVGFILAVSLRKSSKSDKQFLDRNKQKSFFDLEDFDIGYDLCSTSIISTLMNIRGDTCETGGFIILFLFLIQIITALLVRFSKYKKTSSRNKSEVIIPLVTGTFCLVVSCIYIGGA